MALFGDKEETRKIRYAVVGLGWIAQEVVLPAFKDNQNSELVALVTDDTVKADELGKKYGVSARLSYEGYEGLLASRAIDAVYIALPNNMHREYVIRAARAGIHVLCEKPMADTVADCEAMIETAEKTGVKLMIAYRLHFEPANLRVIELIQNGEIGEPRIFNSVFSQQVAEGNVRLKKQMGGGPLMDMGVYQINAARYLFQSEPTEVLCVGANNGDARFTEVHEMASAILRFPGEKIATFTCSFGAAVSDSYQVVGTKGEISMQPAFDYHPEYKITIRSGGKERSGTASKVDQFGGEIEYFSKCILTNTEPEPSGYEGLADIRIIEALLQSMRSGSAVKLEPFDKATRPGPAQKMEKSAVKPEKNLIHAESASGN